MSTDSPDNTVSSLKGETSYEVDSSFNTHSNGEVTVIENRVEKSDIIGDGDNTVIRQQTNDQSYTSNNDECASSSVESKEKRSSVSSIDGKGESPTDKEYKGVPAIQIETKESSDDSKSTEQSEGQAEIPTLSENIARDESEDITQTHSVNLSNKSEDIPKEYNSSTSGDNEDLKSINARDNVNVKSEVNSHSEETTRESTDENVSGKSEPGPDSVTTANPVNSCNSVEATETQNDTEINDQIEHSVVTGDVKEKDSATSDGTGKTNTNVSDSSVTNTEDCNERKINTESIEKVCENNADTVSEQNPDTVKSNGSNDIINEHTDSDSNAVKQVINEHSTHENKPSDSSPVIRGEVGSENTEPIDVYEDEPAVQKELESIYNSKVVIGKDSSEVRVSSAPESTHESDRGYSTELVIKTQLENNEDEDYEDDFEEVEEKENAIICKAETSNDLKSDTSTGRTTSKQENITQLEQDIQEAKTNWENSVKESKNDTEVNEVKYDTTDISTDGVGADIDSTVVVIEGEGTPRVILSTVPDRPPSSEPDQDINREPLTEVCRSDDDKEKPGNTKEENSTSDTKIPEENSEIDRETVDHPSVEPDNTAVSEVTMKDKKEEENVDAMSKEETEQSNQVNTEQDDFYDSDTGDSKQKTSAMKAQQQLDKEQEPAQSEFDDTAKDNSHNDTADSREHTTHENDRTGNPESIKIETKSHNKNEVNNEESKMDKKNESNTKQDLQQKEPIKTDEQLALDKLIQKEESPLDQLLKRHVEIDGSVESIGELEHAVTSLLGSMKEVLKHYQERLKLQSLKDFTVDLGKFRGDFTSINDAYKRCTTMSSSINSQLKELRNLTADVKTQISRKFQNEDLNTWVDTTPEQEKEKHKLQEVTIAAEKALMARAVEAKQAMATATVGVAESTQFVTEMEVQSIEFEATASKAAAQAQLAITAAEEARKAAEERRRAEEVAKKRADERARIKADEEKKKKAKDETTIVEQAALKGSSVEDERKTFMEEKARKEAERRDPKNWPRFTYNVKAGDFDPGVACIIRAIEGSMRKADVTCVYVDQSSNILNLQDQEELIGNIITINQVEEDRKFSFEEPFSIALPVSNNRLPLGKEAVIKQLMPSGKWKTLPAADAQFDDLKEVKFVESRCRSFGTFVATLITRKDTIQFPPKGIKAVSSIDSRITLTSKPGTFKNTVNATLEVKVIDVNAVSELKAKIPDVCEDLLTASPFINFSIPNRPMEKSLVVTMPLPQNQARLKRPVTGLARESKQQDMRPATARPTSMKDDEEVDVIHYLYMDEKNGWTKDSKCTLHQPKNKDVVTFEMTKLHSRFILLRTKPGVKDVRVEKLATLLEKSTSQRNVKLFLRQHIDDPVDIKVGCISSNRIHRALKAVEDDGYTEGPVPSRDLILQEGQQLYIKFRGNLKCVSENPDLTLIFNSNIRPNRQLFVEEIDKFAQKGLQNYRGFLQVLTKALIPRATEPGTPPSKGPPEMVQAEILLCELLIELPKPEAEPPKPLKTAPLPLQEGPLTSEVLHYIAGYLGKEWKDLAIHLNLKPMRIQAILRQNVNKDTPQTRFDMLMTWAKRIPKSVDKVYMLCSALQCVGRQDLVEEVRFRGDEFRLKRQRNARVSHLRQAFVKVAKTATVFKHWQQFAQGLGVSDEDIKKIEQSGGSGQEKCFNVLETWRDNKGEHANVSELASHLRTSKHEYLSREVESFTAV